MNFLQEVKKNMDVLIKHLDSCQNERIQSGVRGIFPLLAEEFEKLDAEEDDLNTKMPFLEKLIKCRCFAETKGNLDNVWKYLHMNKYQKQDQFIETLRDLPQYIKQSREQQVVSISTFLKQSCAELYSHQLVTFNLKVVENNEIKASDDEEEQKCGCITYVSPEVENTRLFKIFMNLPGLMNKVKKLNSLIEQPGQDKFILNLTLDNNSRKTTLWSTEDSVGYYITRKPFPESKPEMEQIIYLDTGMVIQLTKMFSLTVLWATNSQNQTVNDNLNPIKDIKNKKIQDPNQPVLLNPDHYITLASQFEKATFYPTKNPIKIGEYIQLPSGYELLLYNDGVGHYVEVIENFNNFTSFIKSKRFDVQLLQFTTNKIDFNLRLVLEQKVNFQISTNLQVVWDGKDLFDL